MEKRKQKEDLESDGKIYLQLLRKKKHFKMDAIPMYDQV